MVKLVAIYKKPADPADFEQHYREEHLPAVAKVPGLLRTELAYVKGGVGIENDLYLIAELYFADMASYEVAMASPEMRQAGKTLKFAAGLVSMYVAEVEA
jgi:uncharacterized protein (TIGR02118 family)